MKTTRTYFFVYLGLMLLLASTFILAQKPLGTFALPVSLLIASLKLYLVAYFFMELRKADPISRIFSGVGCFWLMILFVLSLSDYLSRSWFN